MFKFEKKIKEKLYFRGQAYGFWQFLQNYLASLAGHNRVFLTVSFLKVRSL